jgi:RNA polymerase sigma-70 factor, ECF subfamily
MHAQVIHQTNRGSVFFTVPGNGDHIEGPKPTSAMSGEPFDELAARRQFEALIATYLPAMRACAARLCRSHYDPDDLVQDALVRAFRTRSRLSDPTRMRAWLLTIVTHTFIDLTRRRRRRPEHVELVETPMPDPIEPAPWEHIEVEELRGAIAQLPDDVRDTYRMFAFEGLDYVAIAATLQIPRPTGGSRIFRARRRLRDLLTAAPGDGKGRGKGPQ